MEISHEVSCKIVATAVKHIGRQFDWATFNCVHFVRIVYEDVGIKLPKLRLYVPPPREFHLSKEGFSSMPVGHSVFFKRRADNSKRPWTHVALILDKGNLIHCSLFAGNGVGVITREKLLEVYDLAP